MTVYECVSYVNAAKPNAFPDNAKIVWLGQLEGRIASEIFLMAPAELEKFNYRNKTKETAKVDSKNGEFNKLSTAAQAFNRLWDEFSAYIANLYDPAAGYYGEIGSGYPEETQEEGGEEFGIVD